MCKTFVNSCFKYIIKILFKNVEKHLEFNVLESCSYFSHSENILLVELKNLAELPAFSWKTLMETTYHDFGYSTL